MAYAAGPAFVQGTSAAAYNRSPISATFVQNVTAGNVIAVGVLWSPTSLSLTSVTATCAAGNFTLLNNPTAYSNVSSVAWGYAPIVTSGPCTV
ncbi:MAG TPA: hypothetical protein VKG84_03690, partial [Candidatus Acidoferrales bacterium]|nr:hypothetical protein [Candidatus Acidoferrales bacterium]